MTFLSLLYKMGLTRLSFRAAEVTSIKIIKVKVCLPKKTHWGLNPQCLRRGPYAEIGSLPMIEFR